MKPFFSIVIANYNFGRFLSPAIESIRKQSFRDFELIIVDGGSTDNSLEVIKKYAKGLPPNVEREEDEITPCISWWCSEPDGGQSAAFNKGFAHAKGKFLTWLNADDIMLPGALEAVWKKLQKAKNADWATGNFIRFRESDKVIIQAEWGPHYLPCCLQGRHFPLMIFGPTTFWRRSVYNKIGGIDETLHYGMDTEYWWRLTVNGYKQVRVNHDLWAFRMHEDSKTAEYGDHHNTEEVQKIKSSEYYYFIKKNGVDVRWWACYLIRLLRLLDFSYMRRMWRKVVLVGRKIESAENE